jgi:hypothetical protein
MKQTVQLLILMCIVAVVTSCASNKNKYRCKGLSAHPDFKKSWTKN